MAPMVPPHEPNPDTSLLSPVFIFESEVVSAPPGTKGRERPVGRERESVDDVTEESEETSK